MKSIAAWLEEQGLGHHAQTFAEHDIDLETVLDLDDGHLREMGLSLGHRLKLMKAIGDLRRARGLRAESAPAAAAAAAQPKAAAEGERRQLTVMFCDLAGSTELSARLDPEDMRDIMRAYQSACAAAIARYDGYLAKFLGDGVLAFFGYPRSHEDAAERAVRAALGIVDTVAHLPPRGGHRLAVRIGIATGLVVVGEVVAADGAGELSAIGETPNLAARLQSTAEANAIVIGDATHALTRGTFRYAEIPGLMLKGIPGPVRAWRVLGEAQASRFEAAHSAGMSAFTGREQEVALLLSRWEQAAAGEGQVVLLCGEAGIGKSRIAEQFRLRVAQTDHVRLRYQCSPFHVNSPLHPAIAQLEHAAGIAAEDAGRARLSKLEALLRPTTPDMAAVVPLFAALLNIRLGDAYAPLELTPDLVRRRTLAAMTAQLVTLARDRPVFWLIEDVHWIDPTTREAVGQSLERIRDARVFVLITFRPEFVAPWAQMPHVTALTLNRLSRRQSAELIQNLASGRALPPEILEQVLAKTDGIPLFIEELTKSVLESGLLAERDGRFELAGPLAPLAIPATLQDSLMARLDRLSPVKEVAQVGAAIGREFGYGMIAAVAPMGENLLGEALSQLVGAELVYARGQPPDAVYQFKHALVQEAAYNSMLRARRQQLHVKIAAALERQFPDIVVRHPELLAHHFAAAGIDERAKEHWARAGRLAFERSSYAEAINHYEQALTLARKAPDSDARTREEAELLVNQAVSTNAHKGLGAIESGRIAEEAVKISAPLGDDPLHFRARWHDWVYNSLSGNLPVAAERADRLVAMANRIDSDDLRLQAHHARWTTAFLRGQVAVTCWDVEQGLALYDFERHRGHFAIYGAHDPGVCARATGACALWQAGLTERAAEVAKDAIRLGNESKQPFSQAVAYWYAGFHAVMVGDADGARTHADACGEVAAMAGLQLPRALARFLHGWSIARAGEPGRGVEQMEGTFRDLLNARQRAYLTFLGAEIAAAKHAMARGDEALAVIEEVEQIAAETHQRFYVSELQRLRAEVLRARDPRGPRIESAYRRAVATAREQGAKALELRAATGLARWLADSGRNADAVSALEPVHAALQASFPGRELDEAQQLLSAIR